MAALHGRSGLLPELRQARRCCATRDRNERVGKAVSEITYWVEWLRFNPAEDGCVTHAVAVPGDGRSLCGVRPTESIGREVDGEGISCKRCTKALVKRGVLCASAK